MDENSPDSFGSDDVAVAVVAGGAQTSALPLYRYLRARFSVTCGLFCVKICSPVLHN